jgi:fluoride exporter
LFVRELLIIAAAGAVGTVSRYVLSTWAQRLTGAEFPFGTLAVNVVGCFLFGLLMEIALVGSLLPRAWTIALSVGFLGAFTTFSTFGYDTLRRLEAGDFLPALSNVTLSVILGLAATWLGFVAARVFAP